MPLKFLSFVFIQKYALILSRIEAKDCITRSFLELVLKVVDCDKSFLKLVINLKKIPSLFKIRLDYVVHGHCG